MDRHRFTRRIDLGATWARGPSAAADLGGDPGPWTDCTPPSGPTFRAISIRFLVDFGPGALNGTQGAGWGVFRDPWRSAPCHWAPPRRLARSRSWRASLESLDAGAFTFVIRPGHERRRSLESRLAWLRLKPWSSSPPLRLSVTRMGARLTIITSPRFNRAHNAVGWFAADREECNLRRL